MGPEAHRRVKRQPLFHVELEGAVRVDVAVDERSQRSEILVRHARHPLLLREHGLKHERVHVHERNLKQVETQDGHLLVVEPVRRDLAALAEEDEAVGSVPALDHVERFDRQTIVTQNERTSPQSVPSRCGLQTAATVKSGLVESGRNRSICRRL